MQYSLYSLFWSSLSAVLFTVLAGLFALFVVRFTAVFSGRNNVSVLHSPRLCSFCYSAYILIFLSRKKLYTFLLFYCFSFNPRRLYPHSLYHAVYFKYHLSTSVTINLHSNMVCGVVIKGQETFTLIAVSPRLKLDFV